MKILLTNLFLQGNTGSESFIYTLAKELRDLGHDVVIYYHNHGWFGDKVKKEGFECWHNPNKADYKLPHTNFDVIHFQHRETVDRIYHQVKHIPKLFLSHGILPAPEQPLPHLSYPMEAYAGVSEETLRNCLTKAGVVPDDNNNIILRNLIDTERFFTYIPIHKELKNVLVISNYMGRTPHYIGLLKQACVKLHLNLDIIGDAGNRVADTRNYIKNAD